MKMNAFAMTSMNDFWLFFFNDTATTEIYTLSLHDALPISYRPTATSWTTSGCARRRNGRRSGRSEEHTSELQSLRHLVCRLLLEKKNRNAGIPGDVTVHTEHPLHQHSNLRRAGGAFGDLLLFFARWLLHQHAQYFPFFF